MSRFLARSSALARPGVVTVLLMVLTVGSAGAAHADTEDEPTDARWSVTPSDADGPDGRVAVEKELDPGEKANDYFAVRNVGDTEVTFRLTAADGFYTRAGRFDVLPADQRSVGAGTWVTMPQTVTIAAGEAAVIPFTVTVPEVAEPGDHAAGITASVVTLQSAEDGTTVGVDSRVGFRVTTRVTGELTPRVAVHAVAGAYELSWNPLQPGSLTATFDVANEGNTILLLAGTVDAGGARVAFPAYGENPQELLPGDSRTLTVALPDVWPLFMVPTSVALAPTVRTMSGDESLLDPVTAQAFTVAIPWPQLIVVAGLGLLIFAVMRGRVQSRRRIAALMEEARLEGRREAAEAQAGS